MIVDTSAIIAIGNREPDSDQLLDALGTADHIKMSAATWVELGIVVDAREDPLVARRADNLLNELGVEIEPVTMEQAMIARQAYRDFGKGRHAAGLNFGDCFSYALAKATGEPLLFKGTDFSHTDIEARLP
ncbi:MAG: type II toxin-antitoxin system VapC family toxin [Candidatus Nanopelagicales bacterium]|nr:type II toxin-antitoxin system VapC family toxin [Candidatus Nanopelagicales bacterium]